MLTNEEVRCRKFVLEALGIRKTLIKNDRFLDGVQKFPLRK